MPHSTRNRVTPHALNPSSPTLLSSLPIDNHTDGPTITMQVHTPPAGMVTRIRNITSTTPALGNTVPHYPQSIPTALF